VLLPSVLVAHLYTIEETIDLLEEAGLQVQTILFALLEGSAGCDKIRLYPPRSEKMEKAGFVCIKARETWR